MKARAFLRHLASLLGSFLLFFSIIAFVITCTFLLFGSSVTLLEEDVRQFAPAVFFNIFVLSTLFVIADMIRRKITVDRPVKQIQKALKRLMDGDFNARITVAHDPNGKFDKIAESINLLARELSSVETLRTDFIANVSHELKTPLAVMQNYATMLAADNISEAERVEYANAITTSCRRLSSLITNILKLNRLENQQIFPSVKEYDLGEQLCECLLQFESTWEQKSITIDTDIAEDIRVCTDSELLFLVWNNLFSNAFKFTGEGGTVTVTLSATDHHATVKITDTGCGMSQDVGAHIFEKFYQGDTSHASEGNGLGLALVKRVVDITGSEISVESAQGVGSTFTVKIRRSHGSLQKDTV